MNENVSIGGTPFVDISHDGATDENAGDKDTFLVVYRKLAMPSPPWEIKYEDFSYSQNDPNSENNFAAGFYASNSGRPNDNESTASAAYETKEQGNDIDGIDDNFAFEDGSGGENVQSLSVVDWSTSHNLVIGFTGSEAYLKIDGSEVARLSGPSKTYYPFFSLEDDNDSSFGEQVTVESIDAPTA
jgi:hypothetical protein